MPNPGEPFRETPPTSSTRRTIDRGDQRDKVNAADPAAVPLGTDAEAGTPHAPKKGVHRHEAEVIPLASRRKIGTDPNRTQAGGMEHGGWLAWAIVSLGLALVLGAFAWGWPS